MLLGLALGSGLIFLIIWLRSRGTKLAWYEWVLGGFGVGLMLFALQNCFAAIDELQPIAPGRYLLVFGLPGLLILAGAVSLIWYRHFRVGKKVSRRA